MADGGEGLHPHIMQPSQPVGTSQRGSGRLLSYISMRERGGSRACWPRDGEQWAEVSAVRRRSHVTGERSAAHLDFRFAACPLARSAFPPSWISAQRHSKDTQSADEY